MEQSTFDPCLFMGERVMCICYVDDLIFWALDESDIDKLADQLISAGVSLEQESNAAGFLGVRMEIDKTTGLMELKQTGLIDRVIETLGLDIGTTSGKFTPAEAKPLVKDIAGDPALGDFSYSSVLECFFIWLGILDTQSIVVLGICFVQEDPMSWHSRELVDISRQLVTVDLSCILPRS